MLCFVLLPVVCVVWTSPINIIIPILTKKKDPVSRKLTGLKFEWAIGKLNENHANTRCLYEIIHLLQNVWAIGKCMLVCTEHVYDPINHWHDLYMFCIGIYISLLFNVLLRMISSIR